MLKKMPRSRFRNKLFYLPGFSFTKGSKSIGNHRTFQLEDLQCPAWVTRELPLYAMNKSDICRAGDMSLVQTEI